MGGGWSGDGLGVLLLFPLFGGVSGGGAAVLGGLLMMVRRGGAMADESACRLAWWEWIPVGGALSAAFVIGAAKGAIGGLDGAILGALLGYLIILLFFQRGQGREAVLRRLTPPRPMGLVSYGVYAALLVLPAAVGYHLPGESPEGPPLQALTAALLAFGIVWLPGVSLAVGLRAYTRLLREEG